MAHEVDPAQGAPHAGRVTDIAANMSDIVMGLGEVENDGLKTGPDHGIDHV